VSGRNRANHASPTGNTFTGNNEPAKNHGTIAIAGVAAMGDRRLVERLIDNLLDNALSYNRAGGHIDVVVGTRAGRASVIVSNTRPVVPVGGRASAATVPMSGFGSRESRARGGPRTLVQAIAEAHGAGLEVSPSDGGGLTVDGSSLPGDQGYPSGPPVPV
jgi:signal transduction histidine kinase